jgi:AraC family transcriptional regulator
MQWYAKEDSRRKRFRNRLMKTAYRTFHIRQINNYVCDFALSVHLEPTFGITDSAMADSSLSHWQPRNAPLGASNTVLVGRSRRHAVHEFPGPLSIKTVTDGRVAWIVDRRAIWLDTQCFLILNDGEPYSMDIDAPRPVSTCCVFFQTGFVETIARDLTASSERLLDDPNAGTPGLNFIPRFHPTRQRIAALMGKVRSRVLNGASEFSLEQCYIDLALELLQVQEQTRSALARIPTARPPTRTELLLRVSRGREYLHAEFCGSADLRAAARAAGMSFFHFHRTFTRAFGKTPAQYVTDLRFERATRLLRAGMPVTDVCMSVGFTSLGSFSAAFRQRYGVSPSALLP